MPKQQGGGQGRGGQSRGEFQGQRSQGQGGQGQRGQGQQGQQRAQGQSQSDLKSREYRDEKGQIHHHTHTYMDQHKGDRGRDR